MTLTGAGRQSNQETEALVDGDRRVAATISRSETNNTKRSLCQVQRLRRDSRRKESVFSAVTFFRNALTSILRGAFARMLDHFSLRKCERIFAGLSSDVPFPV